MSGTLKLIQTDSPGTPGAGYGILTLPTANDQVRLTDGDSGSTHILEFASGGGTITLPAAGTVALLGTAQTYTADRTLNDNVKLTLGTGGDADVWYDGTDLQIDPQVVGSGDLLLAPNGGNVGIGTVSPNEKLVVADLSPVAGGTFIKIYDQSVGTTASPIESGIKFTGYSDFERARITATDEASNFNRGQLLFYTQVNGGGITEKMRIDSGGNVGIGTTSPGAQLDILASSASTIGLVVDSAASPTADIAQFQVNGTSKVVVDNGGNVGIGTTGPGYLLDVIGAGVNVVGNAYVQSTFTQDKTNYRGVWLGYDTSGQTGIIGSTIAASASNLAFYTHTGSVFAERVRIDSTGNVGIGTTNPLSKFEVYENGSNSTLLVHEDAGTHEAQIRLRSGANDIYINNTGQNLSIDTESSADVFTILNNGNVGIGTTSPGVQLDILASSASTIGLVVDSAASPTANLGEFRNNGTAKLKVGTQGLLDFTGTMGNSTKTVGTDAPADWVQVAIGGTTYYLPAYAA